MAELNDFFENKDFFGAIGMQNMSAPLSDAPYTCSPINGYHVFSTKPFFSNKENTGKLLSLTDFELKTAELSALCWKRYNGPIYLITDAQGEAYFKENGLEYAYDGILPILDNISYGIKSTRYWASGKIEALKLLKTPCAIIDLDLIVWEPLELQKSKLTVTHTEHIADFIYPAFSYFDMSPRYTFPAEWDETAEPFNTSFNYIADEALKASYTREAIRFMQFERDTMDNGVKCMVFAEQRILAMCAKAMGIEAQTLIDYDDLLAPQSYLTHIWSAKSLISGSEEIRNKYIELCAEKIEDLKSRLENAHNKNQR